MYYYNNQQSAFVPRDRPIYSHNKSNKYIIIIILLDSWVHVHLSMLVWFPIMKIFQSKRTIYNKKVLINFAIQYGNSVQQNV